MEQAGLAVLVKPDRDIVTDGVRSATPSVYVPRRIRLGGIEEIRTGAAIVGTAQDDGMVAINVEATAYVEPSSAVWITWLCEAVRRHTCSREEQLLMADEARTRLVPETGLIEVGQWADNRLLPANSEAGAEITRWIQAGAADYHIDGYLPTDEAEVA